jgi:hypothetical protein
MAKIIRKYPVVKEWLSSLRLQVRASGPCRGRSLPRVAQVPGRERGKNKNQGAPGPDSRTRKGNKSDGESSPTRSSTWFSVEPKSDLAGSVLVNADIAWSISRFMHNRQWMNRWQVYEAVYGANVLRRSLSSFAIFRFISRVIG